MRNHLLATFRALLRRRFVRFLLVGVLNTLFSYALYAVLVACGFGFALANFLALLAGILFSFRTQSTLVFDRPEPRLLWRFAACWLAIYAFNSLLIGWLIGRGLDAYRAGAVAIVPVTVLSYLVQRFVVFPSPSRPLGSNGVDCPDHGQIR